MKETVQERDGEWRIRLEGVSKSFASGGERVEPLRDVSWGLKKGEFAVMTGPSGSGKSTLLYIAGLLLPADAGKVWWGGREVSAAGDRERSALRRDSLGMVFQAFHLLWGRSVLENVLFRFRYLPAGRRDARRERAAAMEALERVGLADKAGRTARALSAGEAQRAAIARAVVLPPLALLADEPTGNLDGASAEKVMGIFRELNREGMSILLVTHNRAWVGEGTVHWELAGGRPVRGDGT